MFLGCKSVRSANNRNTVPWGKARVIHRGMNKAPLNQMPLPYSLDQRPQLCLDGFVLLVSLVGAVGARLSYGYGWHSVLLFSYVMP